MSQVVGLPNNSYKPITNTAWVRARLCKLQKGYTRLAAASEKAYQLLAHDRWFCPGTPASSTTKTGPHDIAEILLKVALNTKNQLICYGGWSRICVLRCRIFASFCDFSIELWNFFFYELHIENYNIFGVINRMNVQMFVLLIT